MIIHGFPPAPAVFQLTFKIGSIVSFALHERRNLTNTYVFCLVFLHQPPHSLCFLCCEIVAAVTMIPNCAILAIIYIGSADRIDTVPPWV